MYCWFWLCLSRMLNLTQEHSCLKVNNRQLQYHRAGNAITSEKCFGAGPWKKQVERGRGERGIEMKKGRKMGLGRGRRLMQRKYLHHRCIDDTSQRWRRRRRSGFHHRRLECSGVPRYRAIAAPTRPSHQQDFRLAGQQKFKAGPLANFIGLDRKRLVIIKLLRHHE